MSAVKYLRSLLFLLLLSAFFLLLNSTSVGNGVRSLLERQIFPGVLWFQQRRIQLQNPVFAFVESQQLARTVASLEHRLSQCVIDQSQLDQLKIENDSYKKQLESAYMKSGNGVLNKQQPAYHFVPQTLAVDQQSVVFAGFTDGLEKGAAVIADGSLLGFLETVSAHTSTIRFLESEIRSIRVRVQGQDIEGLIRYDGKGLVLDYVPSGTEVQPTTALLSVGDSLLPPNIPVASIVSLESKPSDPVQRYRVEPFVHARQHMTVFLYVTQQERP